MLKSFFLCLLFCVVLFIQCWSQSSTQPAISTALYHPPSTDKESWQRLNLLLSSTYILVAKEGQADFDSCLLQASRSLGVSRFSILAEGLDDPELFTQSQWIDEQNPGKAIQFLSQVSGKKHLELLILLGSYYAFQPQSYFHYRDSVEYFLKKAIDDSKSSKEEKLGRQALCLLGKMYVQANDVKNGDSVFNRLMKECEIAGDNETGARAFAYRGIYTPASPGTVQRKITDLQKAADMYHRLNNTEREVNALTDIGYLLVIIGQLQPAYDVFLKALQLAEAIHYPYVHYNTDALAMVTVFEGKFAEPFKYTLQTIKVAESSHDSIGWAYFYSRLSGLYTMEGGREKERAEFMHKSVDRFLLDHNPAVYNILADQVIIMESEGRNREALELVTDISKKISPTTFSELFFFHTVLASCYNNLRQFELGEMHLMKADSMERKAEAITGPLRRGYIQGQFGFMYYNQGLYRKARPYLEKFLSTDFPGMRIIGNDLHVYRRLIEIDSILHDPAAGLVHYKKYVQLLDSNFTISKLRQAEELQVVYQTEEKENKIDALNQQSKLEKSNLKQATLVKNLTIAGIIAVLIITGLLYRQNRLKQRSNNVITNNNKVITQKNQQLEHLLTEKEWLVKEIHHRVKNNLQIVMSLLNSQSAYIDNQPALTAIHDSQHRVHAMSLIHQKLYNSENLSTIDIPLYIREMISYLADSFNTGQRIRFEFDVEPIELDVSQAVPLGLILNEAITNSIKYAFPDDTNGVISISLSTTSPNHYLLRISDNGIGMPSHVDKKKPGSLGMSLMAGLSEDLDGNFSIENNNGTTIKISFVHDIGGSRHDTVTQALVSNN
jgi:two-component sensor histidine kinase